MRIKLNLLFVFVFILMGHRSMAQDQSAPYEKVEVEASFPGGQEAWNKYITEQLMLHVNEFTKKDIGTCTIRFIVDINGGTKNVQATNMKKTKLAKAAIEAIENGPKWIPAQQDGRAVNAYRVQPVSLQASN
jgi:periplasmic protein TonB